LRLLSVLALLCAVSAVPSSAFAEPREEYLERLAYICELDCVQPRELVRSARKQARSSDTEVSAILDVFEVSEFNGKYLLHSGSAPIGVGFAGFGNDFLGQRTPRSFRPVLNPNIVVIEMDRETFFDILNVPMPGEPITDGSGQPLIDEAGNIVVSKDRIRKFSKPTLGKLRSAFRNRRIVVRGNLRLEIPFVGARRDFRRKKVFIEVNDADEIALLPRYDRDGNIRLDSLPWSDPRAEGASAGR